MEYFNKQALMGDRTIVYVALPKKYWKRQQTSESCSYRLPKDGLDFLCDRDSSSSRGGRNRTKPIGLERLESSLPPQDFWTYGPYNPDVPPDAPLKELLKRAKRAAVVALSSAEKIKFLSDLVVSQMGGPVTTRLSRDWTDCVDVGLSFLKRKLNSNCVPLGGIQHGNALHRAMLFKVDVGDVFFEPRYFVRSLKAFIQLNSV